MKILVCIKQVADGESRFDLDESGHLSLRESETAFRINRYDEFALEEALQIRDSLGDVTVEVVSLGPLRVESSLRRALEMGADNAYHLIIDTSPDTPLARARQLAFFAAARDYDLILTGIQSEDELWGQTGPSLAALMGWPCATTVIRQELNREDRTVTACREINVNSREMITLRLPALLSLQSGINRPRYPSLSHKLRARKQDIMRIDVGGGTADDNLTIKALHRPRSEKRGLRLEGNLQEKAEQLRELLRERSLL